MLNHGGQLNKIKSQYPDVEVDWLDLSTGIAPWSWPVEYVPVHIWQRLPESSDGLCAAAAEFYGCSADRIMAVAGSQVAIELLPECLKGHSKESKTVAIPYWGYGEHARCWSRAGFNIVYYRTASEVDFLLESGRVHHVLAINPNNPSADEITVAQLQNWQQRLFARDGYLIVDEAFADASQQGSSALTLGVRENLVVLRSVGKFFGMAGLRLGFVITGDRLRSQLQQRLILWGVSNPAQWLGERMLKDHDWQCLQRHRINYYCERLASLVQDKLVNEPDLKVKIGPLFVSLFGSDSRLNKMFDFLARRGILVRVFAPQENIRCLRIGLTSDAGLLRLAMAFDEWNEETDNTDTEINLRKAP